MEAILGLHLIDRGKNRMINIVLGSEGSKLFCSTMVGVSSLLMDHSFSRTL